MKLFSNSLSMLIFAAIATALFVLMTLRPAVEGNAMNLGVPLTKETAMTTEAAKTVLEDKAIEEKTENAATPAAEKENETIESESTTDEIVEESKSKDEEIESETEATSEEKPSTK